MKSIEESVLDTPVSIEKKDGMYVLPMGDATVLDTAGILENKLTKITGPDRQAIVALELGQYMPAVIRLKDEFPDIKELYERLLTLHQMLWDIEDEKRVIEKGRDETEFVAGILGEPREVLERYLVLCRQVSKFNDERATIKRRMNKITGSKIVEIKSHKTIQ